VTPSIHFVVVLNRSSLFAVRIPHQMFRRTARADDTTAQAGAGFETRAELLAMSFWAVSSTTDPELNDGNIQLAIGLSLWIYPRDNRCSEIE